MKPMSSPGYAKQPPSNCIYRKALNPSSRKKEHGFAEQVNVKFCEWVSLVEFLPYFVSALISKSLNSVVLQRLVVLFPEY